MDKLKACPFCRKPFEIIESPMYGYMVRHNTGCAFYSDGETGSIYANKQELIDDLNRRPLEDALQAEIERLRKKVERARVLFGLERAARLAVEERLNALRSQYDIWRELNPDNDNDKEAEGN